MAIMGPLNHESVTVSNTAIGITATASDNVLPGAALITVEVAAIRYTVDGTTPTASLGHKAEPGDALELIDRGEVTKFLAFRKDGTDATLKVTPGVEWRP